MQATLHRPELTDVTRARKRSTASRSLIEPTRATLSALGCAVLAVFDLYRH